MCDAQCEVQLMVILCRDRVHQVAYLRNSIAHSPKPSLAEGVAGVAAMAEVLKDHGLQQAAQQMSALLDEVQEASWLTAGVFGLILDEF